MESYKSLISNRLKQLKALNKYYTFQNLANACRVQRPYITAVLKHEAHFSDDQLFAAAKFLKFSEEEIDYLTLLLAFEKNYPPREEENSEQKNKLFAACPIASKSFCWRNVKRGFFGAQAGLFLSPRGDVSSLDADAASIQAKAEPPL